MMRISSGNSAVLNQFAACRLTSFSLLRGYRKCRKRHFQNDSTHDRRESARFALSTPEVIAGGSVPAFAVAGRLSRQAMFFRIRFQKPWSPGAFRPSLNITRALFRQGGRNEIRHFSSTQFESGTSSRRQLAQGRQTRTASTRDFPGRPGSRRFPTACRHQASVATPLSTSSKRCTR
jgi:hypothetical protein